MQTIEIEGKELTLDIGAELTVKDGENSTCSRKSQARGGD